MMRVVHSLQYIMCSYFPMFAGLPCSVSIWNDQVIDVSLPQNVEYVVVETPPNFKGNTSQGGTKPATLGM